MNIYFSGIGGVGIGPLAEIALDAGYSVQGSDAQASLTTKELAGRGVPLSLTQDGQFLRQCHEKQAIDWLIYTASLPSDHPELEAARELGIKTAKRDELISHIVKEKGLKLLAVAGTHGKTTTTGMLIWLAQQFSIPVSYMVGTTISFGPSGKFDPSSDYLIYECDEFDRNFLRFQPDLSIITVLGYDHPDTYPTKESYRAAFSTFLEQSGRALLYQTAAEQMPDGPDEKPGARLVLDENDPSIDSITLPGKHSRQNAWLAIQAFRQTVAATRGLTAEAPSLLAVINSFPGTNRRFEKLADNLYSDYGHTPAEIAATLQMASEISDQVILVYQPHQNLRQQEIKDEYIDKVFQDASKVYWLPTYLTREDPKLVTLTPTDLTKRLESTSVDFASLDDQLWQTISEHQESGRLVLCMGAGSIDGWIRNNLPSSTL